MESFFNYLDQFCQLSLPTKDLISEMISQESLSKGDILLQEGKVCDHLYFIEKGAVRGFHNVEEKEVTYWFGFENTFVTSLHSFISRKPALESIALLEDS